MAKQEFINLGPIYITQAKFNNLKETGLLEVGREYKIIDWEAQEKLIAGTNIEIGSDGKTINALCITLKPMKSAWTGEDNNITTAQAAALILNDSDVNAGDGFTGGVYWTDLSLFGLGNAEVKAFVITDDIVQFEMTSATTEPYAWFFNSWEGTWRTYVPIIDNLTTESSNASLSAKQGKVLNTNLNTHINNQNNPHNVTKTQLGLDNVDNTADTAKPISTATQTALDLKADKTSVEAVEAKIPTQATSENQLADKDFVNSSISTETATFRGTSAAGLTETEFLAWADSLTKDNNDYVFWNTTDTEGNTLYKRYKYNKTAWKFEYSLNNSSFTAAQWSAINSGITTSKITDLDANTAARHSHSNKALLDTYTQTEANLADAVAKKHEHSNKAVIDAITEAPAPQSTTYTKTEVDTALSAYRTSANQDVIDATKLSGVKLVDTELTKDSEGKVTVPIAQTGVFGVIKGNNAYGFTVNSSTGIANGVSVAFATYQNISNAYFITKGTLENALTGKNINDVTNETFTFTLSDGSTVTKTMKVGS